jgi:hypothetical protein
MCQLNDERIEPIVGAPNPWCREHLKINFIVFTNAADSLTEREEVRYIFGVHPEKDVRLVSAGSVNECLTSDKICTECGPSRGGTTRHDAHCEERSQEASERTLGSFEAHWRGTRRGTTAPHASELKRAAARVPRQCTPGACRGLRGTSVHLGPNTLRRGFQKYKGKWLASSFQSTKESGRQENG